MQSKSMHSVLPHHGHRDFLAQKIKEFNGSQNSGSSRHKSNVRKVVMEEFISYTMKHATAGLEHLYDHKAYLFFLRIGFSYLVALPANYEIPLHLKTLLLYLKWDETAYIRGFFESGIVAAIMQTISGRQVDAIDENQFWALNVVLKLASQGRYWKEKLCECDALPAILECVWSSVYWETVRQAGR
jgi:hypothetical protein